MRGAEVRVRDPNGRENRLATTDEDGRYQVDNLLPGTWSVSAAKGGYITQQYGQPHASSAAPPITLTARQRVEANFEITCDPTVFQQVSDALAARNIKTEMAQISRIPTNTVDLDAENGRKVLKLMERLDDHDDVQSVAANFNIPQEAMAEMG